MKKVKADKSRVLVVATTGDYIAHLHKKFSGQLLFVTDREERGRWPKNPPGAKDEILCSLEDADRVLAAVFDHINKYRMSLNGITCFDCESMWLTAYLARALSLPFHSTDTIERVRSKFHSKDLWRQGGVGCPAAALVRTKEDLVKFWQKAKTDVVVKPLTGSGSEHVYRCKDKASCEMAFEVLSEKLPNHPNRRMFVSERLPDGVNPGTVFCAESYVGGQEFSCDAIFSEGHMRIVRVTRKIPLPSADFGAIMAYQMLPAFPSQFTERELMVTLKAAAVRLGFYSAWFMADFKVDNGKIYLLEITPRPGGDCLPPLIKAASGLDVFEVMLDFARGRRVTVPPVSSYRPLAGVLLYAGKAGVIKKTSLKAVKTRKEVVVAVLNRKKGDIVRLPPEDFDSRRLGYVIFEPDKATVVDRQCKAIADEVVVEIEEPVYGKR